MNFTFSSNFVYISSIHPSDKGSTGQDNECATVTNTTFVSVYLRPNFTVGDFDTRLTKLEYTLLDMPEDLVMGLISMRDHLNRKCAPQLQGVGLLDSIPNVNFTS